MFTLAVVSSNGLVLSGAMACLSHQAAPTWCVHGRCCQAVEVACSLLGVEGVIAVQDGLGAFRVSWLSWLPAEGWMGV